MVILQGHKFKDVVSKAEELGHLKPDMISGVVVRGAFVDEVHPAQYSFCVVRTAAAVGGGRWAVCVRVCVCGERTGGHVNRSVFVFVCNSTCFFLWLRLDCNISTNAVCRSAQAH